MHELEFAIINAEAMPDPRKRASTLCSAIVKQARTLELIVQALEEAEQAAGAILDPHTREEYTRLVNRTMEKVGYNSRLKAFRLGNTTVRR